MKSEDYIKEYFKTRLEELQEACADEIRREDNSSDKVLTKLYGAIDDLERIARDLEVFEEDNYPGTIVILTTQYGQHINVTSRACFYRDEGPGGETMLYMNQNRKTYFLGVYLERREADAELNNIRNVFNMAQTTNNCALRYRMTKREQKLQFAGVIK